MAIILDAQLSDSTAIFLHQTRIRSQIIYSVTLIAVLLTLASLPFLYTSVSVKGKGLIQSSIERTELFAPVNGRLVSVNLRDNQRIKKGTTLLTIDASLPSQHKSLIGNKKSQIEQQLADLQKLIKAVEQPIDMSRQTQYDNFVLSTGQYAASLQQYTESLQNANNAKIQAFKIYQRYRVLYDKKVVTQAEYEQYEFNYNQALSDYEMVKKKYSSQWQTEANQYRNELRDLQSQSAEINDQQKQYILKATIAGSLQNLTGVQTGTYVYANQKLGEISPDSSLLAYCYITPADIGLIKQGQRVHFQIDAFNYNQWGLLNGRVIEVSDDIIIQNNAPYFKVKCKLDKNYLQLKNGYKGQIIKGMTFTARFTVTKRSLYQLLYDNIDDWLNPSVGNKVGN
ncbi:HlyD family secretion protein [Pedobacter sp. MW01-1-1]|uniref:HlyD family secretion protein n=1 Tax=Pedobacter sp. MW01-1-1 TaxID=3383027 RepID=UPI003FF03CBD